MPTPTPIPAFAPADNPPVCSIAECGTVVGPEVFEVVEAVEVVKGREVVGSGVAPVESVPEVAVCETVNIVSESAYLTATEFAFTPENEISFTIVSPFELTLVPFAVVRDPTLLLQE
ncbi:hypothetical protein SCARD494_05292 [Seiridium cardinale]